MLREVRRSHRWHLQSDFGIAPVPDIANVIRGRSVPAASSSAFEKRRPGDGSLLCTAPRSTTDDVQAAVAAARTAQPGWAARTPVERGQFVRELTLALLARREEAAEIVMEETGKSRELALGEVD